RYRQLALLLSIPPHPDTGAPPLVRVLRPRRALRSMFAADPGADVRRDISAERQSRAGRRDAGANDSPFEQLLFLVGAVRVPGVCAAATRRSAHLRSHAAAGPADRSRWPGRVGGTRLACATTPSL